VRHLVPLPEKHSKIYTDSGMVVFMPQPLALEQVALRLGVSARRVRAMVAAGQIPADRIGRQWVVDPAAVHSVEHNRDLGGGRPLSELTAWKLASQEEFDARAARGKAALDQFRRKLRARAEHVDWFVHPALLDDLAREPGAVLSGRPVAAQLGVPVDAVDELHLYLRQSSAESIRDRCAARPAVSDANAHVHVVDDDDWPFEAEATAVPPWVAWLDLEDAQDRAADTLLDRLLGGRLVH
jgi:excisionase family DNA binding protein